MKTDWKQGLQGYAGFVVGVTAIGLVLIGWGVQVSSVFLASIGGAIFGAGFNILIATLSSQSFYSELRALVSSESSAMLTSEEEQIAPYRAVWHHYHRTKIDGQPVWRYRRYDLRESRFVGQLVTEVVATDANGNDYRYDVRAVLRGQRFIMLETARSGTEPVVVEVYPFMDLAFMGAHCGIGLMKAWSGEDLLSPCIMSTTQLIDWSSEGDIDPRLFEELDRKWDVGFRGVNEVQLPGPPDAPVPDEKVGAGRRFLRRG